MEKRKLKEIAASNSFAHHIGVELTDVADGYAAGRIRMEEHHTNIYNGMHGGCIYALADTVAGIAASTAGSYVTTVNGTLNYLLPVKDTEYVRCEAAAVRQGNRITVLDVKIMNDEGELLSNGSFTYYSLNREIEE